MAYNVKNVLPLKDSLDKIIKREYKKAFEILDELGIIEYIKIDYKKPKLEILEDDSSFTGEYSKSENKIIFSKKSIEEDIDKELKFLSYKEKIERFIYEQLKSLGYKEIERSTNDIQGIEYLYKSYNPILLYPSYINEKNTIESIAKSIVDLSIYHEIWHSIDHSILYKLFNDSTIEDINYLPTISKNGELRASAFEVVMYYLASGLHKDQKVYRAAYANILTCRNYIEEIDKLEKNEDKNKYIPYELGFCYGNIIVAVNNLSLKENIYNIIDDIVHLDKERAIEVIKLYGDNLEWILQN